VYPDSYLSIITFRLHKFQHLAILVNIGSIAKDP